MTEMRWAARYAFCDPLWRGRSRLIVDGELEGVLRASIESRVVVDAPSRDLLEALVPRERGVPVWMVVDDEAAARVLAPHFAGVRFVPADGLADRIVRAPWETALVTLASAREDDVGGAGGIESRRDATVEAAILGDIAAAMGRGRIAVVTAQGAALDYDGFAARVLPQFGEARIYGGYAPGMFAFAEFTGESDLVVGEFDTDDELEMPTHPRVEPWEDDEALDDAGDGGHDDDAVPLAFDNTLGPTDPPYSVWLAVIGVAAEFAEGLTLIELPEGGATGAAAASTALRRQLHETRRLAELGALERQRLLERVDALEGENAALREAVGQLREQLAGALDPSLSGERLDAALAREQSLRWRVAALEREVAELRVRPVEDLAAALEHARAELDGLRAARPSVEAVAERSADPPPAPRAAAGNPDAARRLRTHRAGSGRTAALRVVEGLVRRIDRGALERTTLRRELVALRRRLRG